MSKAQPLQGRRILIFVGDIYEDLELWYPKLRLIEAGADVVVAGHEAAAVYAGKNPHPLHLLGPQFDFHLVQHAAAADDRGNAERDVADAVAARLHAADRQYATSVQGDRIDHVADRDPDGKTGAPLCA
jgi:putative intracellular protease/amidase